MPDAVTTVLISSVLTPVIIGINEAIKQAIGPNNAHFVPIISVALGIGAGVAMFAQGLVSLLLVAVAIGAAIGLSAVGLYAGSTNFAQAIQAKSATPTPPLPPAA